MKHSSVIVFLIFTITGFVVTGCSSNSDSTTGSSTSSSSASSSSSTSSSTSSSSSSSSSSSGETLVLPNAGSDLLQVVDVDGDSLLDVLWAPIETGNLFWYRNDGSIEPSYTKELLVSTTGIIEKISAIDIDGDGDTDVLLSLKGGRSFWYKNDGASDPGMSKNNLSESSGYSLLADARDMNADNIADVLLLWPESGALALLENSNSLPTAFASKIIDSDVSDVTSVETANLDSDGDVDIVLSSSSEGAIYWYQSDGQPSPNYTQRVVTADVESIYSFVLVDLDSDSDVDVLSASYTTNSIVWNENDGALNPSFTQNEIGSQLEGIYWLEVADLNKDGKPDFLAASSTSNSIYWFKNDGSVNPSFTAYLLAVVDNDTYSVKVADMDNDGDMDVVLVSSSSDDLIYLKNDGALNPSFTEFEAEFNTEIFEF